MYCPHCGAENDQGNRFCVNCGSELPSQRRSSGPTPSRKEVGFRDRLLELLGPTRRARLITAATVVALVVAVVAFLSLDSSGDATADDPYLQSLDQACVAEKERITALGQEALDRQPPNPREFASVLVTALAEWRSSLRESTLTAADSQKIKPLEAALVATLVEAAKLSRSIRGGDSAETISRQAEAVDKATIKLNEAIEELGLSECAELQVSPLAESQP